MISILICLSVVASFAYLLYSGDTAWFTKTTGLLSSVFLYSIAVFLFLKRRHYKIQRLGFLQCCFWGFSWLIHITDEILMYNSIDILPDIIFCTTPLFLTILIYSYLIFKELSKQWNKKNKNKMD